MLHSFKRRAKEWVSGLFLIAWSTSFLSAQDYYPYVLGYTAGESVLHQTATDTFNVSFSGGSTVASQFKATDAGQAMTGMRYDIIFASNAFDQDLFVSKGYFPDYVQLRWELKKYQSSVTSYRIFRRKLGTGEDYAQVAFLSSNESDWQDEFTESGVLYEYKLLAEGLFPKEQKFLNFIEGVGFRLPAGTVSGRVTYKGGAAVEGVSLVAQTDDKFSGTSLSLNGTNAYLAISPKADDTHFNLDTAFTFQAWLQPTSSSAAVIFQKGAQYLLTHSNGRLDFKAGTQTLTLNFPEKVDTFFHVTAVREKDSLKLYVIYKEGEYFTTKAAFTSTTPVNTSDIYMGKSSIGSQYYQGYIDEVRIWYRALEETEILTRSLMYISGTETSLAGYYRMNEGVGDNFFDLSRKGFTFNEEHGFIYNATWSSVIPLSNQLAVKGLTDKNGNYIISGIPYTSDGSTYRIVPIYQVHSFDPTERLLFIGPGSNTFSDVNFTDVSSFPVQGYVYYKNTNFPVEGVQINIDGKPAVTSEGNVITTDAKGLFQVDVPIGKHDLQMAKSGHVFRNNGRFPSNPNLEFDFQSPYTIQQDFIDTTLIKVIGKVVGGPIQGEKTDGFGTTKNNLGKAEIKMTTQKGYFLTEQNIDYSGSWSNQYLQGTSPKVTGTTGFAIKATDRKSISITPDATTGEYFAYLLPEKYVITSVIAGNYTFDNSFLTVLDLENAIVTSNHEDTTIVDSTLLGNGQVKYIYRIDSIGFNTEKDFVYREKPEISVSNQDGTAAFWDLSTVLEDGTTLSIVDGTKAPLTQYPIFTQRKEYKLKVTVFEKYVNKDNSNAEDKVPVTDGLVEIQNDLAIDNSKVSYDIDDFGQVSYTFSGGLPNITTGGIGDYLKPMTIAALTGKNNSISTAWTFNGGPFYGYILGGLPTGNNFVTTGPNEIDMILRDPYGSGSYAYLEQGTSLSKTTSYSTTNEEGGSLAATVQFGATVKTFAGVGAGVITETEYDNEATIGLSHSETWNDNNSSTTTTSSTKRWQTSDDPSFVGSNGDIFIGKATNIVYGKSIFIKFIPDDPACACTDNTVGSYRIGQDVGLRINPEFSTSFMYTQDHVENNLIPNLTFLRNAYLKKASNYTSVFPSNDDRYGQKNTTGQASDAGYSGGDSYNFTIPNSWPTGVEYVDTVAYYNSQIKNWLDILARNEKEKLDATLTENLSFDAGVNFESSTTYETTTTTESSFEFTISPSVALELGFSFNKIGAKVNFEESYSYTHNETDGTETTTSVTFGFVLADSDQGDYYSIDVKQPPSQTGPVFKVRGGQSSCPYIGAEVTKYYQAGTVYSEATAKREVPQISCADPIANAVPEDQKAIYTVQLINASETNDDMWFMLEVNASKNKDGAKVQLDGADLGNGKLIKVPAGQALNKTISIEKIKPDVFDYEDIELVLHSVCQPEDISDTVSLTARFQPVCSKVDLTQPVDKWLVNTADVVYDGTLIKSIPLDIVISNYNLSHAGFEKILVQYKSSSSSQWINDMVYYVDQTEYNAASQPKLYINGQSSLQYTLEMKSLQDRNYDVRVTTTCANGTTNSSSISSGIKDTKRPQLFGTPQPADGILSPGEDVSVQFDEDIQAGLLISRNFQVKGVLNGAEIRHNSVLYFDGVADNASVIAGPDLTGSDFTLEFWTERASNTAGAVWSEGTLEAGFDAGNHFYVKLGNQTITTTSAYTSTSDWYHFAVSYSQADRTLSVFLNDQIEVDNAAVTGIFDFTGRMYVGRNMAGTSFYQGYLHELRVWQTSKGFGEVYANMLSQLSGSEVGLVGYWPMDDANGAIANDEARAHHAILNGASWAVFPRGYAMSFNGTSNYFTIPSGTIVLTNEMDMTLEFWFKGPKGANQVLFSNGKGDQTDATPPYANIWVIGTDNSGNLYATNNGKKLTVTKDVFDNEWHHVALVLNRIANTSLYVDGNLEAFTASSDFGGLSGAKMTLGARMFTSSGTVSYDQYFHGSVDELRIWKLARTKKLLDLDRNAKLIGDEKGLLAYYPFDKYDVDLILQSDVSDNVEGSTATATAYTGTLGNLDIPNVKDARPVQNVAYEWVTNGDKIIITIKEPANLVEKTVLQFTVEDVEDLNENLLSSPITWTAYINKNTVVWNTDAVSFEKKQYDTLSFKVDVRNMGGTEQNYDVTNLPAWLTVDAAQGTLPPSSKKTLTFTVNPSVNIGNYEESIFLSSDFGFKEKLELNLKVYAEKPDWTLDPGKYQYNMSIIGSISINGIISTNPDDMIGAFVNDTLRGVASLQYVPSYDMYLLFLDVYSNKADGETVTFKIWDAAKGKIRVNVDSNQAFVKDILLGSPAQPLPFKVTDNVSAAYYLAKGWNWLSFNANAKSLQKTSTLFSELHSTDGDLIKAMGKFDQFGVLTGWIGEITKQGGFNLKEGYKMKVAQADTFYLVGQTVSIDTINFALKTGWNWIGFPSQLNMNLNDAMGNVNFDNGDFIKGQRSFASYDKSLGWVGSLKFLVPQQAYMVQTKLPHAFSFPNPEVLYANTRQDEAEETPAAAPWVLNPNDFANTMSVIMTLNLCNEAIDSTADYIGAFVGNECRGYIQPSYVSSGGTYFFFLTVYANTSSETVTFKYYDASTNTEYALTQSVTFVNDQITGSLSSPFVEDFVKSNLCTALSLDNGIVDTKVEVFPNPFSQTVKIKLSGLNGTEVNMSITDALGHEVANHTTLDGQWEWNGANDGATLSAGIYLLSIKQADKTSTIKLIKQ